ncbi:MAG: polysaccharide deacetylase family protein [Gaiellaceae bacterium]
MRRTLSIGLAILGTVAVGVALSLWLLREDTISIRIRGLEEAVPAGTTRSEAAERFGLRPVAGDLLDVQGGILRQNAYPGRVLVNGRAAPGRTRLEDGDRLRVVDGRSRREPSTHFFVRIPGGMPSNPQFSLARTPGERELERGRISGKIAPRAFRPSGPSRTPRAVALTFDDGPSPYTAEILAILRRFYARATFFVIGRLARRYPSLVRRELEAGMEVGSHSYSHPYRPPFDRQPYEEIVREIERGKAVLAALGAEPTLFRPPGGSFSPNVIEAAGAYGQRLVLWSVDPTDWEAGTPARQITRRVLRTVRPGSIVVLHDGGGERSQTVTALPAIVRGIRAKGLKLSLIDPRQKP